MQDSYLRNTSTIYQTGKSRIIQIWSMQKDIAYNFSHEKINPRCIFLVGDTNVGKTTLLYYLSGMKLQLIQNSDKMTKEMQPEVIYENAIICNNLSTTQMPNIYCKYEGELGISLIDMPGMNDNRFVSQVSNIFTFEQVFQHAQTLKQIHIAFVISQEMFDPTDIKENIREFIEHFNLETFQKQQNISLIFTKTQDDIDSLKQKFFDFLESIKEDIEQEEDKDIARFIQILIDLNSYEDIVYCFPKEQPDQQIGEQITQQIIERNQFIENNQALLNPKIMENILLSSKLKSSVFQSNFIELLNQLQKTFQISLRMAIQLIKFMHKKIVSSLFEDQKQFQSSKNDFLFEYADLILSFQTNEKIQESIDKGQFGETILDFCQQLTQEKRLYAVDKALTQTLSCKNNEEINPDDGHPKFAFIINLSSCLSKVFLNIVKASRYIEGNDLLMGLIENMAYFYEWISSTWYTSLSKVHSLQRITDKIHQTTNELLKLKEDLWNQLNRNQTYFQVVRTFSEKPVEQDESDSDQQSDQQPKTIYVTEAPSRNELYEKYIKPKYKNMQSTIKQINEAAKAKEEDEQKKSEVEVQAIVKSLEQKILLYINQITENGQKASSLTDEQLTKLFFKTKYLRHRIYLQSGIKNLFQYLQFFTKVIKVKKQSKNDCSDIKNFFNGFIGNICENLEQYSLYEESVLFYLFTNNLEKGLKSIEKGFQKQRITQKFTIQLINKLKVSSDKHEQNKLSKEKSGQLAQILTKCYNFLIAQCSSTRMQQQQYQKKLEQSLDRIQSLSEQTERKQPVYKLNLKGQILKESTFSINGILKRIQNIQKLNSVSKINTIYKKMYPMKQKTEPKKTTSEINEIIQTDKMMASQPSQ